MRDHRLQEGVAIDLVGIPKVDETDGCRPHRRAVPGRPDPSLIPRLPEIFVVVDEPPDRSPNSPDVLSRKPLCQVVWIDQPISEFFQFLTISDLWPLTSRCPLSSDLLSLASAARIDSASHIVIWVSSVIVPFGPLRHPGQG